MNVVNINLPNREHNWMFRFKKVVLPLIVGTNQYSLSPLFSDVETKSDLYALCFRRQSIESLSLTPPFVKLVNHNNAFVPLANLGVFASAEIHLHDSSNNRLATCPIEHAGYDNLTHSPGEYMQVISSTEWNKDNSFIYLDGSQVAAGEVLEIMALYVDHDNCKVKKAC